MAGFKATPHDSSAQLKEVRDQPRCPSLEISTAGLSVHPSVCSGLLLAAPQPQKQQACGTRGVGGLQCWVGERGCPPLPPLQQIFLNAASCLCLQAGI